MSVKFSDHAESQLKTRRINKDRVFVAVNDPDRKLKSFRNRMLRQKQFGSKLLEVVTITEGSKITVITAYYLKELWNENQL